MITMRKEQTTLVITLITTISLDFMITAHTVACNYDYNHIISRSSPLSVYNRYHNRNSDFFQLPVGILKWIRHILMSELVYYIPIEKLWGELKRLVRSWNNRTELETFFQNDQLKEAHFVLVLQYFKNQTIFVSFQD